MADRINYRHLHYFWVVAKEGGMSRAAERLGIAVQTVSAQVRELERALGHVLLAPAGRGLALTEAGRAALRQADRIFALGEQLPEVVDEAVSGLRVRLVVGVQDGLPKLVVHRLLRPLLDEPGLRLVCHEDAFESLLGELALHRLDVVLGDRPAPPSPTLHLHSHLLGDSPIGWYGTPALRGVAQADFPRSLERVPVLLPTGHGAMRPLLDQWFERNELRPRIVGEFEDSALLETFGAHGMGVFPAADAVQDELAARYGACRIGACEGVRERFHAIRPRRRIDHPLVLRLIERASTVDDPGLPRRPDDVAVKS